MVTNLSILIFNYLSLQPYLQFAAVCLPMLTRCLPIAVLRLWVKPTVVRSFIVQYRNASAVSRRITIGKYGVPTPNSHMSSGGAYIKSQAHEGWRLIPDRYDDGAFSPRPAARSTGLSKR